MKVLVQTISVWLARLLAVWFSFVHLFGALWLRGQRGQGSESTNAQLLLSLAMILLGLAAPYMLRFAVMRIACLLAAIGSTVYCIERLIVLTTFYQGPDLKAIYWILVELLVVATMGVYCFRYREV